MGKLIKKKKGKGQGLVEFAIALPILLAITFGLIEFGRLLLAYTAVTASSREAARFGVGIGENLDGVAHYNDCNGMKTEALRFGRFGGLTTDKIKINYILINDPANPSDDVTVKCIPGANPEVTYGDRIEVTATATWSTIIPFINLPDVPITSMASKTIIKDVRVLEASTGSGTAIPYPTNTPVVYTNTPKKPTATPLGPTMTYTNSPIPPTVTSTSTPHPPIGPVLNLDVNGVSGLGGKCTNIVFSWEPNPEWLTVFPLEPPAVYQIFENGVFKGAIDPVTPVTSWASGLSVNNNGNIRFAVRALFAGIYDTEYTVLDVIVNCEGGGLIKATATPVP